MTPEARENCSAYLAVLILIGPMSWLLIGIGPGIAPLWRLIAFYAYVVGCSPMAWALLAAVLDELLERCLPESEPT